MGSANWNRRVGTQRRQISAAQRGKIVMEAFARNDLSADVPSTRRSDEIGEMARTVEVFKTNGLAVERMKAEQLAAEHRTAEQRKADMLKLASDFESAVGERKLDGEIDIEGLGVGRGRGNVGRGRRV